MNGQLTHACLTYHALQAIPAISLSTSPSQHALLQPPAAALVMHCVLCECLTVLSSSGDELSIATTSWTDFKSDKNWDNTARLDNGPQVCSTGQRIVQWTIGLGGWESGSFGDSVNLTGRPLAITGICSNDVSLAAMGPGAPITIEHHVPKTLSGYTCQMLQTGGQTDFWNPVSPSLGSVRKFLGYGSTRKGEIPQAWEICATLTPAQASYVAVGYERVGGALVDAIRFILASGAGPTLLQCCSPNLSSCPLTSHHGNTPLLILLV
jgi:hypothetical protein